MQKFVFYKKDKEEAGFSLNPRLAPYHLEDLLVPNEKVTDSTTIRVLFDYPFKYPEVVELKSNNGFTLLDLGTAIANKYKEIYEEEGKSETMETPCYSWNRKQTHGKYGIWGHYLEDLWISEVDYDETNNLYKLVISS